MNSSSPRIAVVILNWNGLGYLRSFLGTVVEYSSADADVWVIDNASDDGSREYIQTEFPGVRLLIHERNHGFAGGYNLGLAQIEADYYVLLNSDVEVTPNWIPPVLDFMTSDPLMAAAQPLILDQRRRDYFEHAGAAGGYLDANGFPFCAGRIFDHFEKEEGQYSENTEVFWASGAALFVKADLYRESGGLDADFFAHMEEIDLCWRLKNRGYKIGSCRHSKVYHVGGGTLNKLDPKKTYLNFRNNLYLLCKNEFEGWLPLKLFVRLSLDGIAGWRFLTEGKPRFCMAVLKAHLSFYLTWRKTYLKRKTLKQKVSNPNHHGRFKGSILYWYFLKGHRTWLELPKNLFR